MVKHMRKAMKDVMKDRTYHEEWLVTVLCENEAMLNSRPLLPCSNDPNDFDALTHNNFIMKKFDNFAHQVILTKTILVQRNILN